MATQPEASSDPELIGHAFVEQFYTILHEQPEHAHKFYQKSSVLSRPGPDGVMKSVTSVEDINELILSLDFQSYKAEISFADSQFSFANGVIVLVTGSLIGKNNGRRKFTQSFFLAPQEKGYYVSNDVFRYVDDKESTVVANNDVDDSTQAAPEPELTHVPNNVVETHTTKPSANGNISGQEVSHSLDNSNVSVPENGVVSDQVAPSSVKIENDSLPVNQTSSLPVNQTSSPQTPEDAPKKSYLSVVHALKNNSAPFIVRAPAPKSKPLEQPRRAAAVVTAPEASAPKSNKSMEKNNSFSGKNTSIFVANLPLDATEEMLSKVFLKFGPIKPNGIQVRSFKDNKNCFGFVEFESATSVQSAVAVSPITVGNRQANIEEKRGGNNGGRQGRGGYRDENGYRNDNSRGRGNFNGGHNFGRNERSETRGSAGRNEDAANKKIYQNGGGQRVQSQS